VKPLERRGVRAATTTLASRRHLLAAPENQRAKLATLGLEPSFESAVRAAHRAPLRRGPLGVLQLNLGKRCNQVCRHCHVDAGPDRREVMRDDVIDAALALAASSSVPVVDITGGAPELHPRFRDIVERACSGGATVIDRCNLTTMTQPNYADLPRFLARHRVQIIASLPWYRAAETDAQRGEGVFHASIEVLRELNRVGYGDDSSGLVLHLVTNPVGAYLPARQDDLERRWKLELETRHGIKFDHLYTITNMPIGRYLEFLETSHQLEMYMKKLATAFNPSTIDGLMCRSTLSVGWDGRLYDCDFNQMLSLSRAETIFDVRADAIAGTPITVGEHCFGCTAGPGSSCGGSLA
jgi:radical SAM/Cys-rich protein